MTGNTIRRKLRDLGVPVERASWAATKYGDAAPTPLVLRMLEREGQRAKRETERRKFRLWCSANDLPLPTFEFYFAKPDRDFRFDVAWVDECVALEINGGIWRKGGGAHTGRGHLRDMTKLNLAQGLGWRVAQVTPEKLYSDLTLLTLRALIVAASQ